MDYGWDRILVQPFLTYADLFGLSGRCAHNDFYPSDAEFISFGDLVGHCGPHDYDAETSNQVDFRDVAIRGPLVLSASKVREIGALNEAFAPMEFDDHGEGPCPCQTCIASC